MAEHSLASAVSNAGGLGIIAAANAPCEVVREEIRKTRELTDKHFRRKYYAFKPLCPRGGKARRRREGAGGDHRSRNPGPYLEEWKNAGIKVIPVVASVALAKRMERAGADAVIAEGCESGGHIGENTTMVLVPQIVDAVKVPVIAAGGIGDGRGFAAAMMLGAKGVQMGTRFLVAKECVIHENYKQQVLKAKDIDSAVTGRTTGHPVRTLRNRMTRTYQQMEKNGSSFEELETLTIGSLRKAVVEGDVVNGSMMAGQIAGMVTKEQTCQEMIQEIMQEADALLANR